MTCAFMLLQEDVLLPVSITAYSDKTFTYVNASSDVVRAATRLCWLLCMLCHVALALAQHGRRCSEPSVMHAAMWQASRCIELCP